ncbi:TonB-dependent receptor [Novosphingobium sp. Chol11]|uniref:TonB-dependent receptor n=1 Tax=Novosphingobium sp. Chol11 TaxID=1385763 RepID=UPI0025E7B82F|nr:TonB-dependent receptor [Novosphingobium sp. Chol11]
MKLNRLLSLGASISAGALAATAQAQAQADVPLPGELPGEIVVTAQKREQKLQDVALSIQALDTSALAERNVRTFNDYAKFLPSLSYTSFGPGQAQVFFRGLSNGNRLSTGSLPTVGVYLDEQPVTTIGSNIDVHVYDIARVEALAGPQGTLFGASSEAGTLRIITNKPDTAAFSGAVDLTQTFVAHGGLGGIAESYLNIPLSNRVALRLVGFYQHDAGFIDNVLAPRQTYPTSGIERENSALIGRDQNKSDTYGGRAALKVDLDDDWSVTLGGTGQVQTSNGTFAFKPSVGDLATSTYAPQRQKDRWAQATLAIEGKLGSFDVTYAGGYFERTAQYTTDYSDYAFQYDSYYAATPEYFGNNFFNNDGSLISPAQTTSQLERFTKQSHELRIASPASDRLRLVAGLFYQRQTNNWENLYVVPGLADVQSVTGRPGVNYANIQFRTDRDYAAFAEAAFDIVPTLTLTGGLRVYRFDNNVIGFFGFNGTRSAVGEAICLPGTVGQYANRPCDNIDATAKGSGVRHKLNLSWKLAPNKLVYATWSTGFRPGGINRRPAAAPYNAESLTNYEIGWKTTWAGGKLRFNGALFLEKLTQAQFSVTSEQNGITDIVNAGRAQSKGIEADATWAPVPGLSLQASGTYVEATLSTDLCKFTNPTFDCTLPSASGSANALRAPAGTRFSGSPRFKLAATARYEFPLGRTDAYVQSSVLHLSSVTSALDVDDAAAIGTQPPYTTLDLSAGIAQGNWTVGVSAENVLDKRAQQVRSTTCSISICGQDSVVIYPLRPRFISLRVGRKF